MYPVFSYLRVQSYSTRRRRGRRRPRRTLVFRSVTCQSLSDDFVASRTRLAAAGPSTNTAHIAVIWHRVVLLVGTLEGG